MGLFENATHFSHTLRCVCFTVGGREGGGNAKLTEFQVLTISEHNWILLLITHQRMPNIGWLILWGTYCALCQANFSLFTTSQVWKQHTVLCVVSVREMLQGEMASSKTEIKLHWGHCYLTFKLLTIKTKSKFMFYNLTTLGYIFRKRLQSKVVDFCIPSFTL